MLAHQLKHVTFDTTDERDRCVATLAPTKAAERDKCLSPIAEATVSLDDAVCVSLKSFTVADTFTTLPGEAVLELVHHVTNVVVMSQSDRMVQGVLRITTYRIKFSPYDASSWACGSFDVPLSALEAITRDGFILVIACKDLRTIRLAMSNAYTKKKIYDQRRSTPDMQWLDTMVRSMRPPVTINWVFAFEYYAEKKAQLMSTTPDQCSNGWLLYSPVAEYQRLGFLYGTNCYYSRDTADPAVIRWRLLKNSKFRFSRSYPQLMVVPSHMTEEQLVQSAQFRSRGRLPVVVWRHPVHNCVLARSSQPNYGLLGNRSESDQMLLRAYRDMAKPANGNESLPLHIIDARDLLASIGNQVKGKGVEKPQHYDNAVVEFVGIANMHKMRESFDALKALVLGGGKNFYSRLANSKWLKHLGDILSGARRVVEVLHEDGASLVSLAQLMLDPYYRTIRGFAVLIEKEWCSFGHKFTDRIGVGKDAADEPTERSPVMLQFLDCVWQLTRQFPTAFEFNEKLLLHVWDALLSGLYGTFLYNSELVRMFEKVWERTESVWTPVLKDSKAFVNPRFEETTDVLYPRTDEASIVLWEGLVFRWDPERQRGSSLRATTVDTCAEGDCVNPKTEGHGFNHEISTRVEQTGASKTKSNQEEAMAS